MEFEVDCAQLERARDKADGLAADLRAVLADMRLDDVPAAVPGGLSGPAARHVDGQWLLAARELGAALDDHALRLGATAAAYRRTEDAAASAARQCFAELG